MQVATILDRHVACRSLHARQYFDKVVDAPVVQSMPEHVEVAQTVNVPVPQIAVPVPFHKKTDEVILPVTAERTSVCTVAQFVDMLVPQIQEQIVEVSNTIPQERISERIVEYTRDVPVPQIREQIVEVVNNFPQERISERTAEQTVDVTTPQILEEIVEAVSATHERVQQRTVAQPGDQARRVFTDTVHRQGSCSAYCDTATGPSGSDCGDYCASLASAVHRQSSGRASDHAVAATAGPSDSRCVEDRASLDSAVHRQSCESTCDHADASVFSPRERISLEAERDRLRKLVEYMSGHGFGGAMHHGTDA